jgi:hypothetical protein
MLPLCKAKNEESVQDLCHWYGVDKDILIHLRSFQRICQDRIRQQSCVQDSDLCPN